MTIFLIWWCVRGNKLQAKLLKARVRALHCRFWQVPSLVIGLCDPYIHLDILLNSPSSVQSLTRNLAPRLTNLPSQVPVCPWVERSTAVWSVLLKGTTSQCTSRVSNLGHGQDPYLESRMLPLDKFAATDYMDHMFYVVSCTELITFYIAKILL